MVEFAEEVQPSLCLLWWLRERCSRKGIDRRSRATGIKGGKQLYSQYSAAVRVVQCPEASACHRLSARSRFTDKRAAGGARTCSGRVSASGGVKSSFHSPKSDTKSASVRL